MTNFTGNPLADVVMRNNVCAGILSFGFYMKMDARLNNSGMTVSG